GAILSRHGAGGHASHHDRRPRRLRRGLHRGHRHGDDTRQQRPRVPDSGGPRVLLVRQDHRRDDHDRPSRPGHRRGTGTVVTLSAPLAQGTGARPVSAPNASEPEIRIRGVRKVFGANGSTVVALDGIDLDVARGELVCLLGPSGCGKTTLLNAVAGFSLPTAGEIVAAGRLVTEPGPDRGVVFQEYALFPWMTVWDNVAFGLEMRQEPKRQILETVEALLRTLHLTEFSGRFPKDLSGGMRHRG